MSIAIAFYILGMAICVVAGSYLAQGQMAIGIAGALLGVAFIYCSVRFALGNRH